MNCTDKKAFKTKAIAKQKRAQSLKIRGIELYVYKCPECKMWHLSKQKWENSE